MLIYFISYRLKQHKQNTISDAVNKASEETQFNPFVMEIYDKSDDSNCDRLIKIKPFDWVVFAKSGNVYVFDDTIYSCSPGNAPVVKIPKQKDTSTGNYVFNMVCVNTTLSELFLSYQSANKYMINYNPKELWSIENKFTILDALNFLFKRYITFTSNEESNQLIDIINLNNYGFYVLNSAKFVQKFYDKNLYERAFSIIRNSKNDHLDIESSLKTNNDDFYNIANVSYIDNEITVTN